MSKFQEHYETVNPNGEEVIVPFESDSESLCSDILFLREEYIYKGKEEYADYYEEKCMTYEEIGNHKYHVTLRSPASSYIGEHTISADVTIGYKMYEETNEVDDLFPEKVENLVVDGEPMNKKSEIESFLDFIDFCIIDGLADVPYDLE